MIEPSEFIERLMRVGWSEDDALRIFRDCTVKLDVKRQKEAEQRAKKEEQQLAKERRDREKERKRLERERKNAERLRAQAQRAKDRREKLLQRATATFSKNAGIEVDPAGACVQDIWQQLTRDFVLTADERAQTIVLTVEKLKPADCQEFTLKARQLAAELEEHADLPEVLLAGLDQGAAT